MLNPACPGEASRERCVGVGALFVSSAPPCSSSPSPAQDFAPMDDAASKMSQETHVYHRLSQMTPTRGHRWSWPRASPHRHRFLARCVVIRRARAPLIHHALTASDTRSQRSSRNLAIEVAAITACTRVHHRKTASTGAAVCVVCIRRRAAQCGALGPARPVRHHRGDTGKQAMAGYVAIGWPSVLLPAIDVVKPSRKAAQTTRCAVIFPAHRVPF